MRKALLFIFSIALVWSCEEKLVEQTNGFGPYEGQSVYLGDQSNVEAFKALDQAWSKETMLL